MLRIAKISSNKVKKCQPAGIVSARAAFTLTEAIGFAYISALEHYFNTKTGKVELPVDSSMVLNMFKQFFKP